MPRASQAEGNCWRQRTIEQKESPTWGGAQRLEACRARAPEATLGRVHVLVCDADHARRTTIEDELDGWHRRPGERPPPEATAPFAKSSETAISVTATAVPSATRYGSPYSKVT
jgi:hypothetical protein